MKVTSRELTLLIVLGAVFTVYVLYTFLFTPLIRDILISRDALETARIEKQTVENHSVTIPELLRQQEEVAAEAEKKVTAFLPSLDEDLITSFFHRTIANGGPQLQTMSLNNLEVTNLDSLIPAPLAELDYPYGNYTKVANKDADKESYQNPQPGDNDPSKSVLNRRVSVAFSNATYDQAVQQIKLVENLERTILVETFVLSRQESGLSGSIVYNFLGLDKITKDDIGLPETKLTEGNGKANPF